jgi:hypothetical protein
MVEVILPNGTKIMIDETAQQKSDEKVEFVQLTSSERIKLSQKDQTDVVQSITRKQHPCQNSHYCGHGMMVCLGPMSGYGRHR